MAKTKHRVAPSMDNIYTLDGKVPLLKSIPFGRTDTHKFRFFSLRTEQYYKAVQKAYCKENRSHTNQDKDAGQDIRQTDI